MSEPEPEPEPEWQPQPEPELQPEPQLQPQPAVREQGDDLLQPPEPEPQQPPHSSALRSEEPVLRGPKAWLRASNAEGLPARSRPANSRAASAAGLGWQRGVDAVADRPGLHAAMLEPEREPVAYAAPQQAWGAAPVASRTRIVDRQLAQLATQYDHFDTAEDDRLQEMLRRQRDARSERLRREDEERSRKIDALRRPPVVPSLEPHVAARPDEPVRRHVARTPPPEPPQPSRDYAAGDSGSETESYDEGDRADGGRLGVAQPAFRGSFAEGADAMHRAMSRSVRQHSASALHRSVAPAAEERQHARLPFSPPSAASPQPAAQALSDSEGSDVGGSPRWESDEMPSPTALREELMQDDRYEDAESRVLELELLFQRLRSKSAGEAARPLPAAAGSSAAAADWRREVEPEPEPEPESESPLIPSELQIRINQLKRARDGRERGFPSDTLAPADFGLSALSALTPSVPASTNAPESRGVPSPGAGPEEPAAAVSQTASPPATTQTEADTQAEAEVDPRPPSPSRAPVGEQRGASHTLAAWQSAAQEVEADTSPDNWKRSMGLHEIGYDETSGDDGSSLELSPGRSLSPTQAPSPLRRSGEEAPTGLGEEDSEVRTRQEYEQCVQTLASLVVGFGRSL